MLSVLLTGEMNMSFVDSIKYIRQLSVVDALLEGIISHMSTFLWSFKDRSVNFNTLPFRFCTGAGYTTCGLAEYFWMRD
jgi:hypothetical protein